MKRFLKGILAGGIAAGAVLLLVGCGAENIQQEQSVDTAMGTVLVQNIYKKDDGTEYSQQIREILKDLEETSLSRRLETSEVYRINQSAGEGKSTAVSEQMEELILRCREIFEASAGTLDVTIGAVVELWDIDDWASGEQSGEFELPDDTAILEARSRSGMDKISLENGMLSMPEGMKLDFGAVGKGLALDEILAYLVTQEEITGATVSVGGSVLTYGEKPDKSSWKVGIVDPADTSEYIGVLTLDGQWCISTSGDYERYVEVDGVRYHHIIDPATGYPADSQVSGVTVLTKDGFLSDALSTACFILGQEEGMALAEKYDAEVLFVDKDGNITMTEGMKQYFIQ